MNEGWLALPSVLALPRPIHDQIVAHMLDELPNEGCGLLAALPGTAVVARYYPCGNAARSSRVYTVEPRDHLHADRDAEDRGLEIVGVVHSHTHTDPYPSPTDVAAAFDPDWHYVIVSLRFDEPSSRSYRIADGDIGEEALELIEG